MTEDPRQKELPEKLSGLPGYGIVPGPEDAYVAEGKPAKHAWGVQYQGAFRAEADGTARAVRLHARALHAAGIPVALQSYTAQFRATDGTLLNAEATSERVKHEVRDLVNASVGALRVCIKHAVIQNPDFLRSTIIPRSVMMEPDVETAQATMQALYKQTIVYSVWERTTIDPNIAGILRRVGECWVPSEHNAELLRAHGVERVTVIPHPWEESSPLAAGIARAPIPMKRFYSIGMWQPRKGFHELIGAFLMAFRPGDAAHLTVKYGEVSWQKYPSPDESMHHWLGHPTVQAQGWREDRLKPHLALRPGFWPEEKIHELHLKSNIYVSSSHGEAFGLPAFDAKLAGNRMIHVPWGGTADFADAELDIALPFELEPAADAYRWESEAEWASLRFGALVSALRDVNVPHDYRRTPGVERAEFGKVGRLMRERVEAVLGA